MSVLAQAVDPEPTAATEAPTEPSTEPSTEPATEPSTEPSTEPATEPQPEDDIPPQEEWDSAQGGQSDPAPELLNLDKLVQQGKLPAPRTRASGNGSTLLVGSDNEDAGHTHVSDDDMDVTMSQRLNNYPIEVNLNIPAGKLPQSSAILAIKAYDVDEEYGEVDEVFINGTRVGRLTGTNATWNTTILEVPVTLLREGYNYLHITISSGWVVKIDWIQLLLDGGQKDEALEEFSLKLGTPAASGNTAVDLPVTITIKTNSAKTYQTEYTVIDASGNAVAAAFGSVSADGATQEQTSAQLTLEGAKAGSYTIIGLLKTPGADGQPDTIWAQDQVEWYYSGDPDKPAPPGPAPAGPQGYLCQGSDLHRPNHPARRYCH